MKCYICQRDCKNFNSLSVHVNKSHGISSEAYYSKYIKSPIGCLYCKKPTRFFNFKNGYRTFCCNRCSSDYQRTNPECLSKKVSKLKETKYKRYGDENYSNLEKSKATNKKLYGCENVFQSEIIKSKIKNTWRRKYGKDHHSKNEKIKRERRKKLKDLYGVDNQFKRKNVIEIIKQKKKKKLVEISDKIKRTVKERYGVDSMLKHHSVIKKSKRSVRARMLHSIFDGDRLEGQVKPLFKSKSYKSVKNVYRFQCLKCNRKFKDDLDDGKIPRCPTCFPYKYMSKNEYSLFCYIRRKYKTKIIVKDRKILNGFELDMFIPDHNIAIEYNGLYYHSQKTGRKDKNYHLNKTKTCESLGIKLIHIFEDEWLSQRKYIQGLIDQHIKNKITMIPNVVYDRTKYSLLDVDLSLYNIKIEEPHVHYCHRSYLKRTSVDDSCDTICDCGSFILENKV